MRFVRSAWGRLNQIAPPRYDLELLTKQRDYGQEQFDKLIIYLSGGALALSVGFVKDLVGSAPVTDATYLKYAWASFAAALCLNLLSHKTSVIDADYEIKGKTKLSNLFGHITEGLNWSSLLCFIAGVCCFVIFAYPKISNNEAERNSASEQREERKDQAADSGEPDPACLHSTTNDTTQRREEVAVDTLPLLTTDTTMADPKKRINEGKTKPPTQSPQRKAGKTKPPPVRKGQK